MSAARSALPGWTQLATYREFSKSGIVTLVLISVFGGYLIGHPAELPLDFARLALTLLGILFLASGSSALNQLQERHLDAEMPRTANRPLPSGRLTVGQAALFILLASSAGLGLLFWLDPQVGALGIAAMVSYNALYTIWWKRKWAYAAVPGAIPGALPILMGHVAASHQLVTPGGLYLFFLLFFWQMPHFWVLALKYRSDYAQGGFPTLPVAKGSGVTVFQIVLWCLAYVALAMIAPFFLPVGVGYILVTLLMTGKLLWELQGFVKAPESKKWLHFFLWINFSLVIFIGAAAADLWRFHWLVPFIR